MSHELESSSSPGQIYPIPELEEIKNILPAHLELASRSMRRFGLKGGIVAAAGVGISAVSSATLFGIFEGAVALQLSENLALVKETVVVTLGAVDVTSASIAVENAARVSYASFKEAFRSYRTARQIRRLLREKP